MSDLLRIATAGSVDDGKSTLIGRLLYDSKSLMSDQVADAEVDLAQMTDGLRAEREQGITIDVAYRYFATPRRSFIIADTPGHVRYTRNMVTGASTADLAVVLIDARNGVVEQSRRHACLSALLGLRHLVFAVNKMDLVDWDEARFREIEAEALALAEQLEVPDARVVPISALEGDNVVERRRALAVLRRAAAAGAARDGRGGARPQPRGHPAADPVGRAPARCQAGRAPALRRPGRLGRDPRRRRDRRAARGRAHADRVGRDRRRPARGGLPADVGDGPARRRPRRRPRRPARLPRRGAARRARARGDGLLDGRRAAAPGREAAAQAHHAHRPGDRRGAALARRRRSASRSSRSPPSSSSTTSAACGCSPPRP